MAEAETEFWFPEAEYPDSTLRDRFDTHLRARGLPDAAAGHPRLSHTEGFIGAVIIGLCGAAIALPAIVALGYLGVGTGSIPEAAAFAALILSAAYIGAVFIGAPIVDHLFGVRRLDPDTQEVV